MPAKYRDAAERAAWTFAEALVAALMAAKLAGKALDLNAWEAAALAGIAAVLSALKTAGVATARRHKAARAGGE